MKNGDAVSVSVFLCPGVRLPDVGQTQEVVDAGVIEKCQLLECVDWNIQIAQLIIGIGCLMNLQDFGHFRLRQVFIFPQSSQMLQHTHHPKILWGIRIF